MKPLLIGLSGKSGSGKSTAGEFLVDHHGYYPFAFADALKDVVQTAFHFSDEQMTLGKEAVDLRCGKSPRWCLQHFGSAFREVWPQIWIWNLRSKILYFLSEWGQRPIVVTDVRFRDEAEALKRLGAVLVRIDRPGAGAVNGIPGHISETDLDNWEGWDHIIYNIGTLKEFYNSCDRFLARKRIRRVQFRQPVNLS
jgi:hypothetical protein